MAITLVTIIKMGEEEEGIIEGTIPEETIIMAGAIEISIVELVQTEVINRFQCTGRWRYPYILIGNAAAQRAFFFGDRQFF